MSYMYGNNINGIAGGIFQKATISLYGNERSKKITTDSTLNSNAVSNTKNDSDSKLNRILNKFRAGHKLTPAELQYLEEKAPEVYQKVVRIQKQREQLEQEIKNSDSKEEAQQIVTDKISMCMKSCDSGDSFSQDAITNQFQEALNKCQKDVQGKENKDESTINAKKTRNKNGEDIQGTDPNSDTLHEGSKKEDTMIWNSNTYESSGDFNEEPKKQNGKRINVGI